MNTPALSSRKQRCGASTHLTCGTAPPPHAGAVSGVGAAGSRQRSAEVPTAGGGTDHTPVVLFYSGPRKQIAQTQELTPQKFCFLIIPEARSS